MTKDKDKNTTGKIERTYIIPLRKEWLKAAKVRRAKKATIAVKDFLRKHMKSDNIKLGRHLNDQLWEKGIRNPPHKVEVIVTKENDVVFAELVDVPKLSPKVEAKKAEKDKKGKKDAKKAKPAKKAESKVEDEVVVDAEVVEEKKTKKAPKKDDSDAKKPAKKAVKKDE